MHLRLIRIGLERSEASLWLPAALVIVVLATVTRLALNFRHDLAPGMDAAYYPMQTQWLLSQGELINHPPPLIFWLGAILTQGLAVCLGISQHDAALPASRILDCCLHPWIAVPIMLLGKQWGSGKRGVLIGCLAITLFAVISPPVMRMASDYQKNSFGLMLVGYSIWSLHGAITQPNSLIRWLLFCATGLACAFTHVGAFGLLGCFTLGSFVGYLWLHGRQLASKASRNPGFMALFLVAGIGLLLLAMGIDSSWVVKLTTLPSRAASLLDARGTGLGIVFAITVYGCIFWSFRQLLTRADHLNEADSCIVIGCLTALAVLVFPFFGGPWPIRFLLMTPLPIAILLIFGLCRLAQNSKLTWQPRVLISVSICSALVGPFMMQGPVTTRLALEEIKLLDEHLGDVNNSLVVGPHGVEFWAGYALKCRSGSGDLENYRKLYRRILLLQSKFSPGPGRSSGPPDHRFLGSGHLESQGLGGRPRPSDRFAPGRRNGPFAHRDRGSQGPKPAEREIPNDARLVHDGQYFRAFVIETQP